MHIEDVNIGDVVIPRSWSGYHRTLGELVFDSRSRVCNTLQRVVQIDAATLTVAFDCFAYGLGLVWWPVVSCESTQSLHDREKAELQQQLAFALKTVDRVSKQEMLLDREVTVLRSQITTLEKQVADLKAERDRVGKTSQTGTRFAQLELD